MADETADSDSQQVPGEWFAPSVAAARLGISQRTLDRRIAAGKVTRRIRPNGTTQVWLPLSAAPTVTDEMAASDGQEQAERALALVERVNLAVNEQVRPLIELIERQQTQLLEMAEQIGRIRAENAMLQDRQTSADEMADMLRALRSDPADAQAAISQDEPAPDPETPAPPQPGRVRRFLRWLAAAD